jgi:hypothetical protein
MATKSVISVGTALFTLAMCPLTGWSAKAATLKVLKAEQVREGPIVSAKVLTEIKPGTNVTYISRKGFWANIQIAGTKGWVRISALDLKEDGKGTGLSALVSGRGATGNVVNTSGSRGLNAEELNIVTPDLRELEALRKLNVRADEAEAFAKAGQLQSRTVSYIRQSRSKSDKNGDQ